MSSTKRRDSYLSYTFKPGLRINIVGIAPIHQNSSPVNIPDKLYLNSINMALQSSGCTNMHIVGIDPLSE